MRQSLSIVTTLVIFSSTIHAACDHNSGVASMPSEETYDCAYIELAYVCDLTPGCQWKVEDSSYLSPKLDLSHPLTMTEDSPSGDELDKWLPPLEAITESIGDEVYYAQLRNHMSMIYDTILATDTRHNLQISASGGALLKYSRPLVKAVTPFDPTKLTRNSFTLSNVVSIAYIAWWDALTMNDDRFAFHSYDEFNVGRINYSNMMLHTVDDRYVYVPIDQGFARVIVYSWYRDEHDMSEVWREQAFESWQEWYTEWVTKRMKALDFMNQNPPYFPKDMDDELKRKISAIIDIIWGVKGVVLCTDMGISIDAAFDDINDQGSRLESLLQGTGMWTPTELGFILVKDIINDQIKTCTSSKKSVAPLSWSDPMRTIEQTLKKNPHILVQEFTLPKEEELMKQWTSGSERSAMEVSAKQMQYNVGEYGDEQFDAPDQYYWNGFVIGGLLGGTSIVVIVLVFCIGLACGMLCCWGIQSIIVCRKIKDEDVY